MSDLICKIDGKIIGAHGYAESHRERLESVGICPECDRWIELWQSRNNENVARIGGQHYMFGDHLREYVINAKDSLKAIVDGWAPKKRASLGMGGNKVVIRFNDGRHVITNDLWHQGAIPESFKNVLPDNAEMVRL